MIYILNKILYFITYNNRSKNLSFDLSYIQGPLLYWGGEGHCHYEPGHQSSLYTAPAFGQK